MTRVLIAHAPREEACAEELAGPLRDAGFEVAHRGTVLVGDSISGETSRILGEGGPVVLCGTIRALGTRWARTVVNAARGTHDCKVFCVKMEEEADVESVAFDEQVAEYWRDPAKAMEALVTALRRAYPADAEAARLVGEAAAEARYRRLALESYDIVDLANLPESDRHIAARKLELRRLYVPLHVQVELAPESALDDDALRLLEERRAAGRAWSPVSAIAPVEEMKHVPLGERLAASRRLVVLGDPGAGKTTLLRWLATAYLLRLKDDPDWKQLPAVETLPDEDWLPVIVRCRDLDPACASGALDDVLAHTLRKAELSHGEAAALRSLLRTRLERGDALLLIDGLDEITDPALRAKFARQLEQIHLAYPRAPIVATSRVVGYREMGYRIGRGFEHLTVADFTGEEKDDFARRWCALTELPERREAAVRELVEDIHSSDRVERLTGNPMLLTTLALVKRKVGRLPSRRADLYWEALQVLLHWRREVDAPIDPREAIPQLEYLAYEMCDRGVQQLREDEILEVLERMRAEFDRMHDVRRRSPVEFLRLLESRTGILVEAGHVRHLGRPVPVYEFRHLTFQEYLAGLALVDRIHPRREGSESLAQGLSRLAGRVHVPDAEPSDRELSVMENWREAIRLALAIAKYDEVDGALLAVLMPTIDENPELNRRPRAILAALCLADDLEVSDRTAETVMGTLAQVFESRDDDWWPWGPFNEALIALAVSRWAVAMQRPFIAEYCGSIAGRRFDLGGVLGSALAIARRLEDAAELESEVDVIDAGGDAAIAILLMARATASSRDPGARFIGAVLNVLHAPPPLSYPAVEFLSTSVSWQWLSQHVACSRDAEILPALRRVWRDETARLSAIKIISGLAITEAVDDVLGELSADDVSLRVEAAYALGVIGGPEAVPPLILRLEDYDANVRSVAARSLGLLGSAEAMEPLIGLLADLDSNVRWSVVIALGRFGDPRALEAIAGLLGDRSRSVRAAAAILLGRRGHTPAAESIAGLLADPEMEVRSRAAEALGMLGDPGAVEPLIGLLDDVRSVRLVTVNALGQLGSARAVEPLLDLLSRDPDYAREVAQALVKIGAEIPAERLAALLSHGNAWIRVAALHLVLGLRRDEVDLRLLSRDLDGKWPFHDVRRPIPAEHMREAQAALSLPEAELRERIHRLASELGLTITSE